MNVAIRLARRNLGATAENPAVGCVIVKEDRLLGAGWTARGGRPHGETRALAMAGKAANGATAYVTLEPCNHYGSTPPCTRALIEAGLARVVIACGDPDLRVAGQGVAALRAAGIVVTTGVLSDEARDGLKGFLSRKRFSRPHVMLKLAMSADEKITAERGKPTRITGEEVRARVHLMRAEADAILVGVSTVKADDPELTCRLPGLEDRSPVRLVSDSKLTISQASKLVGTAREVPVWVLTCAGADEARADALKGAGVTLVYCASTPDGKVDLHEAMLRLAGRGINTVMAEGGAHMARALIEEDLVDEVNLFQAAHELGVGGLDVLAGLPVERITDDPRFERIGQETLGADTLRLYQRRKKDNAMFTGIVTDIGEVVAMDRASGARLEVACNYDAATIDIGASIACSGICLTVVDKQRAGDGRTVFAVDASAETIARTTLGSWQEGTRINLERAMKLGDEIGGHIVSGHVDGVCEIVSVSAQDDSKIYRFGAPADLARFIAPKGSVALDGTSLTVNDVEGSEFTVSIIPHTSSVTTWGDLVQGDQVNVEIDMLARYVARLADVKA